jgi:hypothetical protein
MPSSQVNQCLADGHTEVARCVWLALSVDQLELEAPSDNPLPFPRGQTQSRLPRPVPNRAEPVYHKRDSYRERLADGRALANPNHP